MAGIATASAMLGWHGLSGDRRFAFRRITDDSGFPWLSASRLPELVLYQPVGLEGSNGEPLPTHVRTPDGSLYEVCGPELNAEITRRFGSEVELMHLKHGIFDETSVSIISLATISGIGRESGAGANLDPRRFRANLILETEHDEPFLEDEWVGGTLVFGEDESRPAVSVIMPDERCVMINLDPETAAKDARVMKTVVRLNQNNAGVYATVVRTGEIRVGQPVTLISRPEAAGLISSGSNCEF
jgi:uncharacterized protein YcbX